MNSVLRLGLLLLLVAAAPVARSAAAEWQMAVVPGQPSFSGFAWYRAWLKPHKTFFSRHERDLWGESTVLNIRGLRGAHEVFVNGKSIGIGGGFPPDYRDGAQGNHRHKVPPGTLVKDRWNPIAIRVWQPEGTGGFRTEAPFIMNYFWECVLQGEWEFRAGDDPAWAGTARETRPARATFDQFQEASRVLGEAEQLHHGEKLPPEESFATMRTPDDLQVDLMLHEPLVAQPTHFSFDSRGRLWVAQYRQYPYPAGLKTLSRDRYYRAQYDRTPLPPPHHTRGRDVISIHEDTNGDGRYDRHARFVDGLNLANAAIRGRGGVWVMNSPYLLFYPDADFDDRPDGDPVVCLQGFGLEDTHAAANGLVWGMDGWLYGGQGSTVSSRVTRPGLDPEGTPGVYFEGCTVWRYHPQTRAFEVFAEGGGNNFGLELDAHGRLFTGHNGGNTRGFHYLQGGMYHTVSVNTGKYGPPSNPYAFGELPMMANDQPIQRFTHFAAVAEGTAIPARYQGSFFAVDPLHNFVIASARRTKGATFRTVDIGKVLTGGDFAFRPVYISNAPDGSILVADFYEHYIAHGQHYQSQIDPTTGRIYRLRGKEMALEQDLNLAAKSTDQLIGLLGHANKWHRHTAVRLLGERADPRAKEKLRDLVRHAAGHRALCALWAHCQAFALDNELAIVALRRDIPMMRYWAVRLAGDDGKVSPPVFDAIREQARYEPNAEVRSQMAATARRLPAGQAYALGHAIMVHEEDADDDYVPQLCWWILEAKMDTDRDGLFALFAEREFWDEPIVMQHILPRVMRRFAAKGRRRDLLDGARLLRKAPTKAHAARLITGFNEAYKGRSMAGLPRELATALLRSGMATLTVKLRLGDATATAAARQRITDTKIPTTERVNLIRELGDLRVPEAVEPLLEIVRSRQPPAPKRAALTALMSFDRVDIGSTVIAAIPAMVAELHTAALELLLSRTAWTRMLLAGLREGHLPSATLTPETIRRLKTHPDADVANGARKLFPDRPADGQTSPRQKVARLETILQEKPGNPYAGQPIFERRCGVCHKLFFKGGNIGPDLTSYQRDNLGTMLTSIVTPSAEIREGYQYISVDTKDERSLSGFLVEQDNRLIVLRGLSGEDIRLQREDVARIGAIGRSLMPEGLLDDLTDQQLRDFFAYLKTSQPINR